MAQNDIYKSKDRYERFMDSLKEKTKKPIGNRKAKYYCKNEENLKYFIKLSLRFESKDTSYSRRMRLFRTLMMIVYNTELDLKELDRDDIDRIVAFSHTVNKSPKSKGDFIKDIKFIWKNILPETDERGRIDETIVPYPVRHLSPKIDRSQQRIKKDRLTVDEFRKIIAYFSDDVRIQAYLMIATDSVARPQEILYRRMRDIQLHDNYAIITISDHGKEGTGMMACIDSYPYLLKWLDVHPQKDDPDAFIFINTDRNVGKQLTPFNINQRLKGACRNLGINKPITPYSFKRNGITFRRLRGDSDMEIQHAARWTSTKQLKTYDMSTQHDALQAQLIKRGLIELDDGTFKNSMPENKKCPYCSTVNPFTALTCSTCTRILDKSKIKVSDENTKKEMDTLRGEINELKDALIKRGSYDSLVASFLKKEGIQDEFKDHVDNVVG